MFPHSPSPINALDLDWHAPSSPRKKQKPCPSGFTVIESFKKIALRGLCGSHKNLSWRSRLQFSFSTPDIFFTKKISELNPQKKTKSGVCLLHRVGRSALRWRHFNCDETAANVTPHYMFGLQYASSTRGDAKSSSTACCRRAPSTAHNVVDTQI